MRRPRVPGAAALGLGVILITACGFWETLKERLAVLGVDFAFQGLDVRQLVYPADIVGQLLLGNRASLLDQVGVDIRCRIGAHNPNGEVAQFDGARANLRIADTSAAAMPLTAAIPAFKVGANADTAFDLIFPLRLSSAGMGKDVVSKVISGAAIPYALDARLAFRLFTAVAAPGPLGLNAPPGLDTSAVQYVNVHLITDSVTTRPDASTVQTFLGWLAQLL